MQNAEEGSYLIRDSNSNHGEMALSVRCKDSVKHFNVSRKKDAFTFGLAEFSNIDELNEHFLNQPFIGGESGMITWLKYPYPRLVEEPSLYDTVRLHAQYGCKRDCSRTSFSIASKEGFLTKLGGCVKNWKLRWFVLKRSELAYFKHKNDKAPIRTLDLSECSDCQRDHNLGKPYCFYLVFGWRTFYFICETDAELQEWIRIIRWKLSNYKKIHAMQEKLKYVRVVESADD